MVKFVPGLSYPQSSFSSQTLIRRQNNRLSKLESFLTFVDVQPLTAPNRNATNRLPRVGAEATTSDARVMPADGACAAIVYFKQASSPAGVRS